MNNPDQNQDWIDEILETLYDKAQNYQRMLSRKTRSFTDELRDRKEKNTKADAKAEILAHQQVAIAKAVAEARIAATQKFSGLWGIGGDSNEHVTVYRRIYGQEMSKWQAELDALTTPKERKKQIMGNLTLATTLQDQLDDIHFAYTDWPTEKAALEALCQRIMKEAHLTKVKQNKSLCGCPMCSYHCEAYRLTPKLAGKA